MQTHKYVSWGVTSVQVVLVVDDDETILVVMARTLAEEGYAVHSAANGNDAFRLAEALHGVSGSSSPISVCPRWTAWRSRGASDS